MLIRDLLGALSWERGVHSIQEYRYFGSRVLFK